MGPIMQDKGYPYPLYTLDLRTPGTSLPEDARYSLPMGRGRLAVRPGLRRRGACISTASCEDAIARALAALATDPEALGRYGFDDAWREALLHWRGRMVEAQLDLHARRFGAMTEVAARRRLVEEGRRRWGRLSLCARLSQLGGLITRGRAPEGAEALLRALGDARQRAARHRERLVCHGFGEEDQAALADLCERLEAALRPAPVPVGRDEESGALQVIRGAILGDVALLCQAAREALPPAQIAALRLRRALLLGG